MEVIPAESKWKHLHKLSNVYETSIFDLFLFLFAGKWLFSGPLEFHSLYEAQWRQAPQKCVKYSGTHFQFNEACSNGTHTN